MNGLAPAILRLQSEKYILLPNKSRQHGFYILSTYLQARFLFASESFIENSKSYNTFQYSFFRVVCQEWIQQCLGGWFMPKLMAYFRWTYEFSRQFWNDFVHIYRYLYYGTTGCGVLKRGIQN